MGRTFKRYLHGPCIYRVVNVTVGPVEDRRMTTGLHTIVELYCNQCGTNLGWKYEETFEEEQQYKKGKFILEKALLTTSSEPSPFKRGEDRERQETRRQRDRDFLEGGPRGGGRSGGRLRMRPSGDSSYDEADEFSERGGVGRERDRDRESVGPFLRDGESMEDEGDVEEEEEEGGEREGSSTTAVSPQAANTTQQSRGTHVTFISSPLLDHPRGPSAFHHPASASSQNVSVFPPSAQGGADEEGRARLALMTQAEGGFRGTLAETDSDAEENQPPAFSYHRWNPHIARRESGRDSDSGHSGSVGRGGGNVSPSGGWRPPPPATARPSPPGWAGWGGGPSGAGAPGTGPWGPGLPERTLMLHIQNLLRTNNALSPLNQSGTSSAGVDSSQASRERGMTPPVPPSGAFDFQGGGPWGQRGWGGWQGGRGSDGGRQGGQGHPMRPPPQGPPSSFLQQGGGGGRNFGERERDRETEREALEAWRRLGNARRMYESDGGGQRGGGGGGEAQGGGRGRWDQRGGQGRGDGSPPDTMGMIEVD
uniref:Yippee domain-containing protein n=1 Tax=Chromera velia CCMP2878 TaxID=1169474 RepID=A0A0G4HA02_9ALVE|eukprot:Cvel_25408.t1-p1 / transcript=Cvel_25408.t1 / gene=Cvel_25408 / organism=Chromera_velia_CCMP2878 / gene_product=Putative yippee-like protein Os10g0369500, putative / transcript_product=Putative yippee-like protein Os10g0369500, putative / location=Cvel_scaffold2875:2721-5872(+) / protein_length=536 / sequence_SO=supercontig / SO=protein_coding / is_pseudo=false